MVLTRLWFYIMFFQRSDNEDILQIGFMEDFPWSIT